MKLKVFFVEEGENGERIEMEKERKETLDEENR